jgi:CPA1 family monovalent cation:H+ antiporter
LISILETTALLLTLSALFGWVNRIFLQLPHSIGLLLLGIISSLLLIAVELMFPEQQIYEQLATALQQLDFTQLVINGMLAFLLFAGALNINFDTLISRAWPIAYLAIVATVISTLVVGLLFWGTAQLLGLPISLPWSFAFGALISPTDPIAVLTMLKSVALPDRLKTELEGEALFNDGVGIVLFTFIAGIAAGAEAPDVGRALLHLIWEAGGGILLGFVTGYAAYRAMRAIDDFPVEVMITLALVSGTYALAQRLGVSGALATVAAGRLVGIRAPRDAMSDRTQRYVSALWTMIDEVLNSVLFLLIGLEVLVIAPSFQSFLIALFAVVIVVGARAVALGVPLLLPIMGPKQPGILRFMTWAGVHGGISIALALALPVSEAKPHILAATYCVVLFSIVVQGLTLGSAARRLGLVDMEKQGQVTTRSKRQR